MSFDEIDDLMREEPGGENHGRKRGESGWKLLEHTYEAELPYLIEDPEYRRNRRTKQLWEIQHGTRAAYVNDLCRCDECRAANRAYIKARRAL